MMVGCAMVEGRTHGHGPSFEARKVGHLRMRWAGVSFQSVKMILPVWTLLSIMRWAAVASASGNVAWITGRHFPLDSIGQTLVSSSRAISAFCATVLGRSVEPVKVRRFNMMGNRSISIFDPC
jgi:hypothetical protein